MFIYTLYYKDTGLYNRSIFVMPNEATAIKAMKLNLMDKNAERFRNECSTGEVELRCLAGFTEEDGIETEIANYPIRVCNLKDLINDNDRNMETTKQDNT